MRPKYVVLLAVIVLACVRTASAADQPAANSAAPTAAYNSTQQQDFSSQPAATFRMPTAEQLDRLRRANPRAYQQFMEQMSRRRALGFLESNTCYTMRSYYYERVDGGDAMQRVGETTCTPSNRVQPREAGPR
jgi:hypothetical protein